MKALIMTADVLSYIRGCPFLDGVNVNTFVHSLKNEQYTLYWSLAVSLRLDL